MLKSFFRRSEIEAGCDEAGRGCLAGPVFAAAVILPSDYRNPDLNDSKLLSQRKRELLRIQIEKEAIAWNVSSVNNEEIDEINILNASILAMHKALEGLDTLPSLLLIDGNRFHPYKNLQHVCLVKGDSRYLSIAAASILAKTHRDEFMMKLHENFPHYCWNRNKGYPTSDHRKAIALHGITIYHRKSFNLNEQMRLVF
jgi:ribonuclease HII